MAEAVLAVARVQGAPADVPPDPAATLVGDLIRRGQQALVVGAGHGDLVSRLAHLVGPHGRVHVIEPNPALASLVVLAAAPEDAGRVTVHQVAATAAPGTLAPGTRHLEIVVPSRYDLRLGSGRARVTGGGRIRLRVRALTLDDWAARAGVDPALVVLDGTCDVGDVLAAAPRLLHARHSSWLIAGQVDRAAARTLENTGHRCFDPHSYGVVTGAETAAGVVPGLLAVPGRGGPRRWRRAPIVRSFASLPFQPSTGDAEGRLQTDFTFLPAGRWLITARLDGGRRAWRLRLVDSAGIPVARGVATATGGPDEARCALAVELSQATACRCVATCRGVPPRATGGRAEVEEVQFA